MAIIKVDLQKSYRILNPGATTLVSAKYGDDVNAMAITWAQALDYDKVTIVPHNGSYTRTLIEKSGYFAVQIPTAAQAELVSELGAENNSRFDNADKMKNVEIFYKDDSRVPLIAGCAAWLVCKRIPEPHNEQSYDLFIGEVVAAYADERSRFFYLRAKGKAEKKIAALDYDSVQIARLPAIKSEREQVRMGEIFTIWLFGLLPKFILTNYRPMSAKDIAVAVIAAAQTDAKGVQIYHPKDFLQTRSDT